MGKNINLEIPEGVLGLLLNADKKSGYQGERFYFKGDLHQMSTAQRVAEQLGISTDVEGGIPFVMSKTDFEIVTQHLIDNRLDGWHHYVSHENTSD